MSLNSFIGQYLLTLDFSPCVRDALSNGWVDPREAAQLARLTVERLEKYSLQSQDYSRRITQVAHPTRWSRNSLDARIRETLGEVVTASSGGWRTLCGKEDELPEIDLSDKRHLFYEEMKRFLLRDAEIEPEDIDDESLDKFMVPADQLSNAIYKIELKRRQRENGAHKLLI